MRVRRWPVLSLLAGLTGLAGLPAPARGAIVEVTDCGDTTPGGNPGQLRALITAAAPANPTTIVVPACTITLPAAAGDDANQGGDLDVPPLRRITIQGAGVGRTILDGGGLDRVLDVGGPDPDPPPTARQPGPGPRPGTGLPGPGPAGDQPAPGR